MYNIIMKTTIKERSIAIDTLLKQKIAILQQLEEQRNQLTTEIVQLQGKSELLRELQSEEEKVEK